MTKTISDHLNERKKVCEVLNVLIKKSAISEGEAIRILTDYDAYS